MSVCSIFNNFSEPSEERTLESIVREIASPKYKKEIDDIRLLIKSGKKEEANKKKSALTSFTPSGTFNVRRLLPNLKEYSFIIHLDFDKLKESQLESFNKTITQIPFTLLSFKSPSGNGFKVFVKVNSGSNNHDTIYKQVLNHYEEKTGISCDQKCKDITRLCFMSYDPDLYYNSNSEIFDFTHTPINNDDLYSSALIECLNFTEHKKTYQEGNRNDFVYLFASNCNRRGIPVEITSKYALDKFDLNKNEIIRTIKSSYASHTGEFATFANLATLQTEQTTCEEEDYLKTTICIPEKVYLNLPEILKDGALAFTDHRERDVFFTGALSILSGCLPGVKGLYAGEEIFPNLFSFSIAPAASGKGALKFAKMLADEYHNTLLKASRDEENKYNMELEANRQKNINNRKGNNATEPMPEKPPFIIVFVPANCSCAKIIYHLDQNKGAGIICETEADTLGNVFKQEWGSYSDLLRKSFHHEKISSSKKTNNEFTEVNAPRLSIALSGTPSQVTGLIASAEDGLFSRFIFYAFKVDQKWKDVSPKASKINLTEHFGQLSKKVYEMVLFLSPDETYINLSEAQWAKLNKSCEAWLDDITLFTGEEAASIVKRLGLIMFRICMLFTALRKFENKEITKNVYCSDIDFNSGLALSEVYLHHSKLMYNNLPKQKNSSIFKPSDNKLAFFNKLSNRFVRKEAVELGKTFNLSVRTVDGILHKAVGKFLNRFPEGVYEKIIME